MTAWQAIVEHCAYLTRLEEAKEEQENREPDWERW